jgi:thiol-disulfide isomerase/thioredoxin
VAAASVRRKRAIAIGAAVVVALGVGAYFVAIRDRGSARPAAPAIELVGMDGARVSLAALRGKIVLIDFWATWCEPCRVETPMLIEMQRKYAARGVQLLSVSMDDEIEPVRDFYREVPPNYPVVIGDATLGQRFGGILGLPVKFLIDREGRIAARHEGAFNHAALTRKLDALLAE